jgi:hypothetical protein
MKNDWFCKLLIRHVFQWNRTQEADGSIPFISTISFVFYFRFRIRERLRRQRFVEARDFTSLRERLLNSGYPTTS